MLEFFFVFWTISYWEYWYIQIESPTKSHFWIHITKVVVVHISCNNTNSVSSQISQTHDPIEARFVLRLWIVGRVKIRLLPSGMETHEGTSLVKSTNKVALSNPPRIKQEWTSPLWAVRGSCSRVRSASPPPSPRGGMARRCSYRSPRGPWWIH